MNSKWRVLGQALCFVFIVPVLLLFLFGSVAKIVSPNVESKLRCLLFGLCGTSQIIASAKLRARSGWGFGWAKVGSYILDLIALVLIFLFVEMAFIAGYYIVYPNTPPLFGGD